MTSYQADHTTPNSLFVHDLSKRIIDNISKVIVGKENTLRHIVTAMLINGHVLIEDVPGTGKTKMAKALALSAEATFKRIQFTIDLLPSDLTGIHFYNKKVDDFVFRKGPLFTHILLADEINRATARTQSSLLECMEEHQISADGERFELPDPFFVIATQNPVETQGTFPLPEAQMDRFMMQLSLGYPDTKDGVRLLNRYDQSDPLLSLEPVCTVNDLHKARDICHQTKVHDLIIEYINNLIEATRNERDVLLGASPRASIALMNASKAYAAVLGRDYVTPDDVKTLFVPVIAHRLLLNAHSSVISDNNIGATRKAEKAVTLRVLEQVACPTEDFSN